MVAQLKAGLAEIGAIRLSDIYEAQRAAVQVGRHLCELAHVTQTQLKLIA